MKTIGIRAKSLLCASLIAACPWAHAQLETRGERDAAGAREQMREMGEQAPTLQELSLAYDRASASWMQVFGMEPFINAAEGSRRAAKALRSKGWAAKDSWTTVSMLDARGDAAWIEDGICRAQVNVGSDGTSPVSKLMGPRAFEFLAAHELAHCLFDAADSKHRAPQASKMSSPGFPIALSAAQAKAIAAMIASPLQEDGSNALADAYDEALADSLAASALMSTPNPPAQAIRSALSLRLGAASLSLRQRTAPPAHLGAYALWTLLAKGPAPSLEKARELAMASALAASLASPDLPRWAEILRLADPAGFEISRASARKAYQPMLDSRDLSKDEDLYMAARSPSLFSMQLDGTPKRGAETTPEQAMARWKAAAWSPARPAKR